MIWQQSAPWSHASCQGSRCGLDVLLSDFRVTLNLQHPSPHAPAQRADAALRPARAAGGVRQDWWRAPALGHVAVETRWPGKWRLGVLGKPAKRDLRSPCSQSSKVETFAARLEVSIALSSRPCALARRPLRNREGVQPPRVWGSETAHTTRPHFLRGRTRCPASREIQKNDVFFSPFDGIKMGVFLFFYSL